MFIDIEKQLEEFLKEEENEMFKKISEEDKKSWVKYIEEGIGEIDFWDCLPDDIEDKYCID